MPLPIVVKSFDPTTNATQGTPPYYMIAFALGGTPVTTLIGSDESKLSWTVTQPVGSKLVLSVVDANGSAGGVTPRIMTVIPGQTTQCVIQPPSTPEFTVTTNVTGDLKTCQPWGFTVKGGVPPYTITLLSPNSPVVTNASIGLGDDHFTYINRADPGGTLVGAISDLTGRWANGTAFVSTKGSTDVACTGLVSSSGNSTVIAQQALSSPGSKSQRPVIIGVSVTVALLVLLGIVGAGVWYRRRSQKKWEEEEAKAMPEQFTELPVEPYKLEGTIMSINNFLGPASRADMKAREALGDAPPPPPPKPPSRNGSTLVPTNPPTPSYQSSQSGSDNGRYSRPGFTSFPSTSIRRSAKSIEAGVGVVMNPTADPGSPQSLESGEVARIGPPGIRQERNMVIQHQDAGIVSELPPPYADRGPGRPS